MSFVTQPLTIYKDSSVLTESSELLLGRLIPNQTESQKTPTVLVGSGISLWQPTGLPSGQNFMQAMYSVLFENQFNMSKSEKYLLSKIFGLIWSEEFSGMPFEHLMECCPSEEKANRLINKIYTSDRANPVHEALAEGLEKGLIHSIITTNYDCCIDKALDSSGINYAKVVTTDQAKKIFPSRKLPCYFKIHGSTEPGLEHTPMFSLKHEGLIDPTKRRLLALLMEDRPLVIIGYSGLDFELCPEIERINIKEIIWNDLYDEPPSTSAKRLLEKKGGYLIYGDMHIFIRNWLGLKYIPKISEDLSDTVKNAVKTIFSEEEINLWRIKVLNSLGLPSFVFKAINYRQISAENSYFASIHLGRAHFHAGRYKNARQNFYKAIWQAIWQRNLIKSADAALEISDAYRSFGAPIRSYLCTWLIDLFRIEELQTKKLIKQSLVVKDFIEITQALKNISSRKLKNIPLYKNILRSFSWIREKLRIWLEKKLVNCARESLQMGNWIDFQQTALIAEGLNIDISTFSDEEYYMPPKAAEGYRHLGYYIPQTMVFYDRCIREKTDRKKNPKMRREWKRHIKICKMLGINSSLWKILALSSAEEIKSKAEKVFNRCEYGWFKRIFDWKKFAD